MHFRTAACRSGEFGEELIYGSKYTFLGLVNLKRKLLATRGETSAIYRGGRPKYEVSGIISVAGSWASRPPERQKPGDSPRAFKSNV